MKKVSVIIPTYNRAKYLRQSIESALAQNYGDIEVVVSDNASTDGTSQVIEDYLGDRRLKYFRNEENIGMVPNWRKALLEYAAGDLAIILDDDDYFIDRHYIGRAMRLLEKDENIALIHANTRIFYENKGYYKDTNKKLPEIADGRWMFINYKYALKGAVNYDKLTELFNRKMALELNFFSDAILSSDRESFLKMSLMGKVGFINDVVAVYRIHSGNLFRRRDLCTFFENMRAITNPFEFAKRLGTFNEKELERWRKRMIRESCEIQLIGNMMVLKDRKKFLKEFASRLYHEYPFALTILIKFLEPRILAKLVIYSFGAIGGRE